MIRRTKQTELKGGGLTFLEQHDAGKLVLGLLGSPQVNRRDTALVVPGKLSGQGQQVPD